MIFYETRKMYENNIQFNINMTKYSNIYLFYFETLKEVSIIVLFCYLFVYGKISSFMKE